MHPVIENWQLVRKDLRDLSIARKMMHVVKLWKKVWATRKNNNPSLFRFDLFGSRRYVANIQGAGKCFPEGERGGGELQKFCSRASPCSAELEGWTFRKTLNSMGLRPRHSSVSGVGSRGKWGVTRTLCPFLFAHFSLSISKIKSQSRDSIVLEC